MTNTQVPEKVESTSISLEALSKQRLGEILVAIGAITPEQLEEATEAQGTDSKRIGQILIGQGVITHKDLALALSLQHKVPLIDLKNHRVSPEALSMVPERLARQYDVLPLDIIGDSLLVVIADPDNISALEDLSAAARMRVQPMLGVPDEIREAIDLNYKGRDEIEEQIRRMPVTTGDLEAKPRISQQAVAQAPAVRALDLIIEQAVKSRASDIHIEPFEDKLLLRYRIDGILQDIMSLPLTTHATLLSRVKIMANMNIAERRRSQDGQFLALANGREVDIRVATVGTIYGEMAVLRLLDKSLSFLELPDLGFLLDSLERYQRMIKVPLGMILVSGPTGSGKTTTLYASINQLDRIERKVTTIEDPVEYRFGHINQLQVNREAGITFPNGLRALLRADPDVILVGEIRDAETAQVAGRAALTGHLVFSSIHANDSVGTIFRLIELGVEPFVIASSLVGVVSQRIVRRNCPHCSAPYQPPAEELMAYEEEMQQDKPTFYSGTGCNFCSQSGYLGRTGVFEILSFSEEIRRMLLAGASASDIKAQAIKEGMVTLRRDGMLKAKEGVTTLYEVLRNVFSIG